MTKYIDVEKVQHLITETGDRHSRNGEDIHTCSSICADLVISVYQLPAADIVEVVRCKDCRYWDSDALYCSGENHYIVNAEADDYCSYWERKMTKYIDADKIADELSKVPWYEREDEKQAIRMIKEFPAADVQEVQQGRWENIEHAPDGLLYVTCSVCGKRQTVEFTSYCGNCGAKMEREDE